MPACDEVDLDDIEDIVGEGDLTGLERSIARSNAVVKHLKKKNGASRTKTDDVEPVVNEKSGGNNNCNIPGTQKVYVKTWGCAHNNSDSEYMAGQLAAYGYGITGNDRTR